MDIRLLLDNIRSTHNAGSVFRTAETLGISKVYCGGTTPAPIDRFGRKRADIAKVSLGGEELVPWEQVGAAEMRTLIVGLKKEGFQIISIEQDAKSVDYKKVKVAEKALIIVGNEVGGVARELLDASDVIAEIPLRGKKESLNVSVATGVALFRLLDR